MFYNAIVRLIITYGTTTWHELEFVKTSKVIKAIKKTQASGMRIIGRAYRATPIRELEAEIFTSPVNIYCAEFRVKRIRAIYTSPVKVYIQKQYKAISNKLYRRNPRRVAFITASIIQRKLDWANKKETTLSSIGKKTINQKWSAKWQSK